MINETNLCCLRWKSMHFISIIAQFSSQLQWFGSFYFFLGICFLSNLRSIHIDITISKQNNYETGNNQCIYFIYCSFAWHFFFASRQSVYNLRSLLLSFSLHELRNEQRKKTVDRKHSDCTLLLL